MKDSDKFGQTSQPDVAGLGTRVTTERACNLGCLDWVRLDGQGRGERQTWRGVRGEETRFENESLLVIDGDKVQPDPHCSHVGV